MIRIPNPRLFALAMLTVGLAACSGEPEETTYEVDATDLSGGELIATPADQEGVEVDLPDTPMTPVPDGTEPVRGAETMEGAGEKSSPPADEPAGR